MDTIKSENCKVKSIPQLWKHESLTMNVMPFLSWDDAAIISAFGPQQELDSASA